MFKTAQRRLMITTSLGAALLLFAGCATSYQSKGLTGGYDETQLAEDTYQIRFQGNAYTRDGRVSQFMLRRGAELALEQDKRWFMMRDASQGSRAGGSPMWGVVSYPSGTAIVKILDEKTEEAFDALLVMDETNALAGNRMSPGAREKYMELKYGIGAEADEGSDESES